MPDSPKALQLTSLFGFLNDQYHLLSVKTASMLMYEVKNRIDEMNVWVDGQHARTFKKDNKFLENGFSEILGITEIGFSHSDFLKMGNYSFLNVRNRFEFYETFQKYALDRMNPEIWSIYDFINEDLKTLDPVGAGYIDLSRYEL